MKTKKKITQEMFTPNRLGDGSSSLEQKALVEDKSAAEDLRFPLNVVAGEEACSIFLFRELLKTGLWRLCLSENVII